MLESFEDRVRRMELNAYLESTAPSEGEPDPDEIEAPDEWDRAEYMREMAADRAWEEMRDERQIAKEKARV